MPYQSKLQPGPDTIDRTLNRQGHTRMLAVGRLVPDDWEAVRVQVLERREELIVVSLERSA